MTSLSVQSTHRHYPEIGEALPKEKPRWITVVKKIIITAALIFASTVIGCFAGGGIGAAIGLAIGVAVSATLLIAKCIHDLVSKKRLLYQLPQEGSHKALLPPDAASLGAYYKADVRLTETANESLFWKEKIIDAAEESIEISCNFAGGTLFRDVLSRIDKKMADKPAIKTHILLSHDNLLESADKEQLQTLATRYPDRFAYLISDRHRKFGLSIHTEENHMKMVVVDGKYFVSGGTGLSANFCRDTYQPQAGERTDGLIPPATKDTDLVGKSDKIAQLMRDQFFNLYRLWEIRTHEKEVSSRYFPLTKQAGHCPDFATKEGLLQDVRLKYIVSGPEHGNNNPIIREYQKRISRASKEIRIANWKFCPTAAIQGALLKAKADTPDIKVIAHLNGMADAFSLGRYYLTHTSRAFYHLVDKVYEYTGSHQLYHKKVTTFDNTHLMIGSFNFNKKSAKYDHEGMFVVKNSDIVKACKKDLQLDKKRSIKRYESHFNFFAKIYSCLLARITQNEV